MTIETRTKATHLESIRSFFVGQFPLPRSFIQEVRSIVINGDFAHSFEVHHVFFVRFKRRQSLLMVKCHRICHVPGADHLRVYPVSIHSNIMTPFLSIFHDKMNTVFFNIHDVFNFKSTSRDLSYLGIDFFYTLVHRTGIKMKNRIGFTG